MRKMNKKVKLYKVYIPNIHICKVPNMKFLSPIRTPLLTHLFPMDPSLPSENIRKPSGFLIFSGG